MQSTTITSRVYRGRVHHHRKKPVAHGFQYDQFQLLIDLEEFEYWQRKFRFLPASLHRSDYLPSSRSLIEEIQDQIFNQTAETFEGRVMMLSAPRCLGVLMNPISLFFCYRAEDEVLAYVLAEVTNTPWGERHVYVLKVENPSRLNFYLDKHFHVSPFMPMDTGYHWCFTHPEERFDLLLKVTRDSEEIFAAGMILQGEELSPDQLKMLSVKEAFYSIKVWWRIYSEAFQLWWKKVPFHPHPRKTRFKTQPRERVIL